MSDSHIYALLTYKKDYFKYEDKSNFFGHTLQEQMRRIKLGLKKFKSENIIINLSVNFF